MGDERRHGAVWVVRTGTEPIAGDPAPRPYDGERRGESSFPDRACASYDALRSRTDRVLEGAHTRLTDEAVVEN